MGFLLRRSPARALAGWFDTFDRPNENPVLPPWNFWGDSAAFALVDNKLKLAAEGAVRGGNPDGGVAFEHQPLTENWGVEFVRTISSGSSDAVMDVWLDKNWTEGGSASSTRYQVYVHFERDTKEDDEGKETVTRSVKFYSRDKSTWLWSGIGSDSFNLNAAAWTAAITVKVHVFEDRYMIGWINGYPELLLDLYDPNYRFGPRKRSANFAQIRGPVSSIDDFKTYDLPANPLRKNWTSIFFDDFDRANSTTVGNGWAQTAGNNFGIHQNGLSMNSPVAGSDGYRQVRRDAGAGDVRIEFVLGDGIGDPNLTARSAILARMNAAGTQGLACIIHPRSVTLHGFTWGATLTRPEWTSPTQPILAVGTDYVEEGHQMSFNISGDYAWVFNHTLDRLIAFRDGINALASPSQTWIGAFIARYSFVNSVPVAEVRVLV
ncbi:hypothetical protein CH300_00010 [Rhodococcus sp. 15-1154-1]|nr:hypothetical protein [Rhodococcus sp. 15-1154-1]OZF09799.1 hypothetical protein CH300_00010 [Rhodococcus sp. 15-1154-1]